MTVDRRFLPPVCMNHQVRSAWAKATYTPHKGVIQSEITFLAIRTSAQTVATIRCVFGSLMYYPCFEGLTSIADICWLPRHKPSVLKNT